MCVNYVMSQTSICFSFDFETIPLAPTRFLRTLKIAACFKLLKENVDIFIVDRLVDHAFYCLFILSSNRNIYLQPNLHRD